ncbi:enoyl reductase [Microbispora rosea]|uniref:Enoyl reductase n=1 Tax=Microbispora rosea TaxID=58117 RepID=A0A1N6T7M4_9ACTN|nr:hypothetical protein [Microbispora rosea]GIH45177.1 hypothetical protein Mro03_03560 [Microbispora rosea subsp. rosea]SIQ49313.1 enoyl reductase [Microbispora rosea]
MRAIAVTSLLAGALLALCAPPAAADPDVGAHGEAFQKGNTAGVKLTNSKIGLSGNGLGGKSDGYRMPRPCWYEPNSSADDMRNLQAQQKKQAVEAGLDYDVDLDRFGDKIGDKGQWWGVAYDAGNPDGPSCAAGLEPLVWVPEGTVPAGGITLEQLMQIARAALTVPEPKIKLSPDAKSYVNLGTWVWLDGAEAAPRSVTATLPGVMSATVTATPDHLEIDAGTKDDKRATVFTAGCGTTGKPYVKGADEDGTKEPECGVVYRHSSVDLPGKVYTLTVTSVWTVAGNGNQGGEAVPFAYDPIQVSATRDVPVGEVQSIVKQ